MKSIQKSAFIWILFLTAVTARPGFDDDDDDDDSATGNSFISPQTQLGFVEPKQAPATDNSESEGSGINANPQAPAANSFFTGFVDPQVPTYNQQSADASNVQPQAPIVAAASNVLNTPVAPVSDDSTKDQDVSINNAAEASSASTSSDSAASTSTSSDKAAPASTSGDSSVSTLTSSDNSAPANSALTGADPKQNTVETSAPGDVDVDQSVAQKRSTDLETLSIDQGESLAAAKREAKKGRTMKLDFGVSASGAGKSSKLRRRFPSAFCDLERDNGIICPGIRRGNFIDQFYFEPTSNRCYHYVYNGCGGNANRFSSLWECTQSCARKVTKAAE